MRTSAAARTVAVETAQEPPSAGSYRLLGRETASLPEQEITALRAAA